MKYLGNDKPLDWEGPPRKGAARYFQTLWDNLGGLLGGNLLACAGFLPLALGVSLGAVYENFWLTLLGGGAGGALAGLVWTPLLSLCCQALSGGTRGWWRRWKTAFRLAPGPSALLGGCLGLLSGGFLLVGSQLAALSGGAVPMVSVVLLLDFFLLSLAAAVGFPALCVGERSPGAALGLLARGPARALGAALGLLAWGGLLVGLFPVSVPFAAVAGFWPPALLCAQLALPMLDLPPWEEGPDGASGPTRDLPAWEKGEPSCSLTVGERGEIFWRRRWPLVLALVGLTWLVFWGGGQLLDRREPDVQIAIVHAQPLPDGVIADLEEALAQRAGDRNGDGEAVARVNDYAVVFDGTAADAERQTAGMTLLVSDLAAGQSALYAVEDPANFLERYGDKVDASAAVLWGDCPGLPQPEGLASLTVLPAAGAEDGLPALLTGH